MSSLEDAYHYLENLVLHGRISPLHAKALWDSLVNATEKYESGLFDWAETTAENAIIGGLDNALSNRQRTTNAVMTDNLYRAAKQPPQEPD